MEGRRGEICDRCCSRAKSSASGSFTRVSNSDEAIISNEGLEEGGLASMTVMESFGETSESSGQENGRSTCASDKTLAKSTVDRREYSTAAPPVVCRPTLPVGSSGLTIGYLAMWSSLVTAGGPDPDSNQMEAQGPHGRESAQTARRIPRDGL